MALLAINGAASSRFRVAADSRTTGFAAPPTISLSFAPMQVVVLFSGKPPYTLAVGAQAAGKRYLDLTELVPDYRPGAETKLAQATVATDASARLALVADDSRLFDRHRVFLWVLLLGGVAVQCLALWFGGCGDLSTSRRCDGINVLP